MPRIVLHHLVNSRSERIFWLLEELGLTYDVKVYQRKPWGGADPGLKQAGTMGKAPAVDLDDEPLSESAYILHRLLSVARARESSPTSTSTSSSASAVSSPVELHPSSASTFHAHFAEGTLMLWMQASLLSSLSASGYTKVAGAQVGRGGLTHEMLEGVGRYAKWAGPAMYVPETQRHLDQLDAYVAAHPFFSGTAAPGLGDFMLAYPLGGLVQTEQEGEAAASKERGAGGPPRSPPARVARKGVYKIGEGLQGWWARVSARPAYQRALERIRQEEAAAQDGVKAKL